MIHSLLIHAFEKNILKSVVTIEMIHTYKMSERDVTMLTMMIEF